MNSKDLSDLKELYSKVLKVPLENINAPHSFCKYQHIYINRKLFESLRGRSASSSIVMAMHHSENGVRAARVLSYALHTIVASNFYCFSLHGSNATSNTIFMGSQLLCGNLIAMNQTPLLFYQYNTLFQEQLH